MKSLHCRFTLPLKSLFVHVVYLKDRGGGWELEKETPVIPWLSSQMSSAAVIGQGRKLGDGNSVWISCV